VLIIDEINRANVASVFGELLYLLEYRDESLTLSGGGAPFAIPANVRIIVSMNSADRSIALVDYALRRRFAFVELQPNYAFLHDFLSKKQVNFQVAAFIEQLQRLNQQIGDRHYAVGTSFFLRDDLSRTLPDIWQMEIEPYLEEYFFDQPARVDEFRWPILARAISWTTG
jgi:5-methylcytosine-specific restriction protein B